MQQQRPQKEGAGQAPRAEAMVCRLKQNVDTASGALEILNPQASPNPLPLTPNP